MSCLSSIGTVSFSRESPGRVNPLPRGYSERYNDFGKNSILAYPCRPNDNRPYRRSSIIPTFVNRSDSVRYFILAKRWDHTSTVTDFGGRNNGSESWRSLALREFTEESYGILGRPTFEQLEKSLTFCSDYCTVTFWVWQDIDNLQNVEALHHVFYLIHSSRREADLSEDLWEKSDFVCFSSDEFDQLLSGQAVQGFTLNQFLIAMLGPQRERLGNSIFS